MRNANCANCKFWLADADDGDFTVCRRYPPRIVTSMVDGTSDDFDLEVMVASRFPAVSADSYCGEWQSA